MSVLLLLSGDGVATMPLAPSSAAASGSLAITVGYRNVVVATPGLVSYWRLGESSGPTAVDEQSTNHGIYNGAPTYSASSLLSSDSANTAVTFSGATSEYAIAKSGAILAGLAAYTIECWLKTSTNSDASGDAIYSERAATGNDILKLEIDSAGNVQFTHRDDAGLLSQPDSAFAVTNGVRHHVALTKSGTTIKVYVDGALKNTATLSGGDTMTNAGIEAWIAGDKVGNTSRFNGTLDEVAIYDTALDAASIAHHHEVGTSPGLVITRLQSSSATATGSLALTASTQIPLAVSSASATGSLGLRAATTVVLTPTTASVTGSLALTAATQITHRATSSAALVT